ncbi:lef-11 [Adoxophyes orana granulovirus]|uniref:Late expression factor 11 n=1 Tax=Adoxophyes orana granulovirus TaxID=170617 RepID=Q7T9W5_GVAO|nr:lef-11 [Adoxophyes orana granulovirus]AAP85687.1 lef-11 [Adoxophyes orana granulovirus]AJA91690.1 late expression factor 11 [Adoxophyes orana granulovirus]
MLTKSLVYSIVKEVINYKKFSGDTENVTAHVESGKFENISQYIDEHCSNIIIRHSDGPQTSADAYKNKLKHLFKLPNSLELEYEYCCNRNNATN